MIIILMGLLNYVVNYIYNIYCNRTRAKDLRNTRGMAVVDDPVHLRHDLRFRQYD